MAECVLCAKHKELEGIHRIAKSVETTFPGHGRIMSEYFEHLYSRRFKEARDAIKRAENLSYEKIRRINPFRVEGDREEQSRRRWEEFVEGVGHAILPGNPERGLELLELAAWAKKEEIPVVYKLVRQHFTRKREVPRSIRPIYAVFYYLHDALVEKIIEEESRGQKR